jgi:hypothetical protein
MWQYIETLDWALALGQKKEYEIRSRKSTERHYNGQKKEYEIRSRKSTERHYNGQKKKM